jgi:diadenosine tetraphosphate (Ap4A) HIT family hydrolase
MDHPTGKPCLFCTRPSDQHQILFETEHFWVRADNFPVNHGHINIVSQRHIINDDKLTVEEWTDLKNVIRASKAYLYNTYLPDGFNFGMNDGLAAGQTIMHLHWHLIPRYANDVPNPRGGVRNIKPAIVAY